LSRGNDAKRTKGESMQTSRPVLVLFPGAWGNRTHELATWWFRHVINHFKGDYEIVVVTYAGGSLDQYVESALEQLKDVPDGSLALVYSMGAQIARGVATTRPTLFKRVALISGLERTGVRFSVFLQALTFMIVPMLRTLVGRPLKLDTVEQVKRVFFQPLSLQVGVLVHARDLLEQRLIPEPAWPMLRLFLPGLRRRFPPFPCPVMVVVPQDDFILPGARYPGEQVQRVDVSGEHALVIDHWLVTSPLNNIATWFLLD